ncbi:unnamed protein product [Camellia sinensis]
MKGGRNTSNSCGFTTCSLPQEMLVDILTRLPAKVVVQCKCISKHWRSLIEDPSFVDLHHTRAQSRPYLVISLINCSLTKIHFFSADYEGGPAQYLLTDFLSGLYHIKQSVNGLICGYLRKSNSIFIVNPTTRQFVTLPPTRLLTYDANFTHEPDLSFGFDPFTKQYKVLLTTFIHIKGEGECYDYLDYKCEIFTLGTHSWREIDCLSVPWHYEFGGGGCCVNGVIHWRNRSYYIPKPSPPMSADVIVTFELKNERFQMIPLPRGPSRMHRLRELGGHLVACDEYTEHGWEELWILQDYENWIWVKEIMMPTLDWGREGDPYIVGAIQTGEILPQPSRIHDLWNIYYYDRNRKSFRKIKITGLPDSEFPDKRGRNALHVTHYVENLFSLSDI